MSKEQVAIPEEVASRYAPLIRQTAHRVARRLPAHVLIDDLISAGFLGLIDAYKRYEPSRCDRFDVYAEFRIRGSMLDELRTHDTLSRDMRARSNKVNNASRQLSTKLGRSPKESEVAGALGVSVDLLRDYEAKIAMGVTVSLDAMSVDAEPKIPVRDSVCPPPDERLHAERSKHVVNEAMGEIQPRLKRLLEAYYTEEKTLKEIGDEFGVTESRACQLHTQALQAMRAKCRPSRRPARRKAA